MLHRLEYGVVPDVRKRYKYAEIRKFMISRGVTHRMSLGAIIVDKFCREHGFSSPRDARYTTIFNSTTRFIELIPGGLEYFKFSKNTIITLVPQNIVQEAGQNWADWDFGQKQYLQWFDEDSKRLCIKLLGI